MQRDLKEAYAELEREHWWFRARRRILLDIARRFVRAGDVDGFRIADIGCGPGANPEAFSELGDVTGVEISADALDALSPVAGARKIVASAAATGLPEKSFNLVLCLDVLEHLEDDRAALAECLRITAPGGAAIVTVPAVRGLWSAHDCANMHLRRYEKAHLVRLACGAGYGVEFATYFNAFLFLPAVLVRMIFSGRGVGGSDFVTGGGIVNRLLEAVFTLERSMLRISPLPFGMSICAVLRKPKD